MVWNTPTGNIGTFEPGANYDHVGEVFSESLETARADLERVDPHSAFAEELQRRANFIEYMCEHAQLGLQQPYWTWWGNHGRWYGGGTAAVQNGSLAPVNATRLQVKNATSPGLGRSGDEDCIATADGPSGACSVSRRLKRRKQQHM